MRRAAASDCLIVMQSISEFYVATARKRILSRVAAADHAQELLAAFPIVAATPSAVRVALQAATQGRASYWDALLVASAADAGCTAMLSEDMADQTSLLGVRIINPFAPSGLSAAAHALLSPARR